MKTGSLIVDIQDTSLSQEEREMLQHPLIGGVILFSRNYESPEQLNELTTEIHGLRTPKLLITVDHEGGRVQRFKEGFSLLPAGSAIGDYYDQKPDQAKQLATQLGWLMAVELKVLGVDLSFAPVLDVDDSSQVIGDRAFHADPHVVGMLAEHYVVGMNNAGMSAVGKHFPGHGSVVEDSHITQPIDTRSIDIIKAHSLIPFQYMINKGLNGMMTAHICYPNIDHEIVSFSKYWLNHILRSELGFNGIIFSDDLSMMGAKIEGDINHIADVAITAGCDIILVCNQIADVYKLLDNNNIQDCPNKLQFMINPSPYQSLDQLHQSTRWQECVSACNIIVETQAKRY